MDCNRVVAVFTVIGGTVIAWFIVRVYHKSIKNGMYHYLDSMITFVEIWDISNLYKLLLYAVKTL